MQAFFSTFESGIMRLEENLASAVPNIITAVVVVAALYVFYRVLTFLWGSG